MMRKQANCLALLLCCCVPFSPVHAEEWRFSDVERIVAVSDIHGAYDALVATLQESDVIDDSFAWSGGKTHLVITGDLLDRGPESRRAKNAIPPAFRVRRSLPFPATRASHCRQAIFSVCRLGYRSLVPNSATRD